MQRADLGALVFGFGDVGDVDGVLGVDRAAEVTAAEVLAALLRDPAEGVVARLAEVDRDRQRPGFTAHPVGGGSEGVDLGQGRVGGGGPGLQRLLR